MSHVRTGSLQRYGRFGDMNDQQPKISRAYSAYIHEIHVPGTYYAPRRCESSRDEYIAAAVQKKAAKPPAKKRTGTPRVREQ